MAAKSVYCSVKPGPYIAARELAFSKGLGIFGDGQSSGALQKKPGVLLPETVRLQIRSIWRRESHEKTRVHHAAKQAFCFYLDHTKAVDQDLDDVVNVGIAVGMLAEQLRNASADAFIGAFEAEFLRELE